MIFNNLNLLESFALVCDADDKTAEEEFERLSKIFNDMNTEEPIPGINLVFPDDINSFSNRTPKIGVFVFPNNRDIGRLEGLFLSCVKNKPGMECVTSLENPPRITSKANALASLSTQYETRRGVGGAAGEGIWEFDTAELNNVKTFIENL
jgi:hypothetical protein